MKIIGFCGTKIEKHNFHHHKNPISIDYDKMIKYWYQTIFLSVKKDFKCFIRYKDDEKVNLLC